jgi:GDP-4-dehydro-6-deoxy-D-mannose reductase
MKALVTGGGGFCGSHLRRYLEDQGVEVHTIGERPARRERHHQVECVTDMGALGRAVRLSAPDYIFHLAGVMVSPNPIEFFRINTQFAVGLLRALTEAGYADRPVLLVGTAAEYGVVSGDDLPISEDLPPRPYDHYGISKLAQTLEGLAASRDGRRVAIVRPFNLIGPGMSEHLVLRSFASQIAKIAKGEAPSVITVGNIKSSRDFVDVRDAVAVYWKAARNPACYGEILNVCTGRGTAVEDALRTLLEIAGVEAEVRAEASRLKNIDIPAHYGSTAKLTRLLGPLTGRALDSSLADVFHDAMERPCAR